MPTNKILKETGIIIAIFLILTLFLVFITTEFHKLTQHYIINDILDGVDDLTVNSLPTFIFLAFLPYLFFLILRGLSQRKILIKKSIKILISIFLFILYYFSISYVFDCQINDNIWGQSYFKGKHKVCYTSNLGDPCFQYTSKVNADFDSFKVLGNNKDAYGKDGEKVFYPYAETNLCFVNLDRISDGVPNSDPDTFEVLGNGYAKDKNSFYKDGRKLEIDEVSDPQKPLQISIDSTDWVSFNTLLYKASDETGVINFAKIAPGSFNAAIQNSIVNPNLISDWSSQSNQVLVNAAYFNEDKIPSGFLVVNGETIGKEIFDQDKSGLLLIQDDKLSIRDLATEPLAEDETFDFALQSYPFLIKNHQEAIKEDSGQKARRSAIGTDKDGNVYVLISDSPNLSLYEFMNILYDSGIDFENVLNLDGGPSSGLYVNFNRYSKLIDSQVEVPSILKFIPQKNN